ncbi:hypothetical protein BH24ACT5_BH24ACT5_11080 [soil metagenome]
MTATGRALLIGSETYGLTGCDADVGLMTDTLAARGFDKIDVRTGKDASRAGIIDGFEQLLGSLGADDAAVVYYSGHGARVVRPDFAERQAAGLSVNFQFIVPFDLADSDTGDFRGVLSEELTQYQRRLTEVFRARGATPNVTTILDCCHAGYMARNIDALPKSVDAKSFRMRGLREHLEQLGGEVQLGGLVTNPDAVRLVACQPEQSAYEFPSTRGGRHGALTDALATVLVGLGAAPVSWAVVGDLVRRRVRALQPEQRPEVEGPTGRRLFSNESVPSLGALPVTVTGESASIEGAELLGLAVGDEFRIVMAGAEDVVGIAVVGRLSGGAAVLEVTGDAATALVDGTAIAVPIRISVPRLLVHIGDVVAQAAELRNDIANSTRLMPTAEAIEAIAGVGPGVRPDTLTLLDPVGDRWRVDDLSADRRGRLTMIDTLETIAVGHRALDLASGQGSHRLETAPAIAFSLADGTVLPQHGARLRTGQRVRLTIGNTGADTVYVWVFDIGVSGRSALLSNAAPSGTTLGPADTEDAALDVWGPEGEALFWPSDVPTTSERPESFVVLVADRRADLSSLSSRSGATRGSPRSPLDALVAEARTGTREVAPSGDGPPLRYRLDAVEFFLTPS